MPIWAKKTGMKMLPAAPRSRATRSWWWLAPMAMPAMKAPMMNASLAASASSAKPSIRTSATTVTVAGELALRCTRSSRRGTPSSPTNPVTSKNAIARPSVPATMPTLTDPPVTILTTTVRITRPSTSSATAAPRTTLASVVARARRSPNTRAVMPTLVAVSAAPTKIAVFVSCPNARPTAVPPANGAATPMKATSSEALPTLPSSARSISMPTWRRSSSTPISATTAMDTPRASSRWIRPSADGPTITPARISPSTAGTFSRSAISASTLAAPMMISRSSSRRARSIPPSAEEAITPRPGRRPAAPGRVPRRRGPASSPGSAR